MTPVIRAAYDKDEDGLPIKTNAMLKEASKRLLHRCTLNNIQDVIKLMEALD